MFEIKRADDLIIFLNSLESRYRPQQWKFNEVDIWPVLRNEIYHKLSLRILNSSHQSRKLNYSKRFIKSISKLVVPPKIKKVDYLLVSDSTSYLNLDNQSIDKFCDPIISIIDDSNKSWCKIQYESYFKKNYLFEPIGMEYLFLKQKIHQYFYKKKHTRLNECVFYSEIFNLLEEVCEALDNQYFKIENFSKRLQLFELRIKGFQVVLSKLLPKFVFIVDYYNFNNQALIYACNNLGIPNCDIQHGSISEVHAAYSGWLDVPSSGYNTIPNFIFVWSDYEKKLIDKCFNNIHKAIVVFKLIDILFQNKSLLIEQFCSLLKAKLLSMNSNLTILFTMQYGIEYDDALFNYISKTQNTFNWIFRLHPVDLNSKGEKNLLIKLEEFSVKNFEYILSSNYPLEVVLDQTDLHITHSSSVTTDAFLKGIPSLVFSEYGYSVFKGQIDHKHLILETDFKEIGKYITARNKNINMRDIRSDVLTNLKSIINL